MEDCGSTVATYTNSGSEATPDDREFNIEIAFEGELWTAELQAAFVDAAAFLGACIVADIPDALVMGDAGWDVVDDIRITAELGEVDGAFGVLGHAGPTALRLGSYLPATAAMRFDIADAERMHQDGEWSGLVLHEMMHALGFGSLWSFMGLLEQGEDGTVNYTGANGVAWYEALYGTPGPVPVETNGGPAAALGHWDEATFGAELMTGYVEPGVDHPISPMSIGSLADLGYGLAPEWVLVG
jgi:hypothetical protein